jgi:hypothetical protein
MIHYTCDLCKRELDADELRYVVKLEIGAAMDPLSANEMDDDRDQLLEVQEILERLDDADDDQVGDEVFQQMRFDLCPSCCRKYRKNPLGRDLSKQFTFSKN